jgi:linoleoyl-CoA desaturase
MTKVLKNVSFNNSDKVSFLTDVRHRVNAYFESNNISRSANTQMILKTIVILLGWAGTYGMIMSNLFPGYVVLLLALVHGFFTAMIGLNIAHDAIHGSYSSSSRTNKRIGLLFNLIGANDYVWHISHNMVHHTYTNIPDYDEDINQPAILRLEPTQKLRWIHRFQHIYALVLYAFSSLSWVFVKDYVKFFQHQLGGHFREKLPRKELLRLILYKSIYYSIFLVLPLVFVDFSWYWILIGFILSHLVEGFTLAIIFMLAHVVEGTDFPELEENGSLEMTWAELQMKTTSNFARKNKVATYLFGGLNFQIEHHLFPKVCHIHYPAISDIVKQTAKAHNLPYLEHPTLLGAIASHRRVLYAMGQPSSTNQ